MNKRELEKHCKHIVSYGPTGWGLEFLRRALKDEEIYVKNYLRDIKTTREKIKAYKKAIQIAENL